MLLEVMSDTGDICRYFHAAGETHTSHFAKRRVRLLWCGCVDARANATSLRATFKRRSLGLTRLVCAALANQLRDSWHYRSFVSELLFTLTTTAYCSSLLLLLRLPPRSGVSHNSRKDAISLSIDCPLIGRPASQQPSRPAAPQASRADFPRSKLGESAQLASLKLAEKLAEICRTYPRNSNSSRRTASPEPDPKAL